MKLQPEKEFISKASMKMTFVTIFVCYKLIVKIIYKTADNQKITFSGKI